MLWLDISFEKMFPNRPRFLDILFVIVFTSTAAEDVAKVDGDIYIAGLFEIETAKRGECGVTDIDSVMVLEATRWYIEQLNEHNSLPFKLGFKGYKTCGLPRVAVERALDITARYKTFNHTGDSEDFVIGFLGPSLSEESKRVSEALTLGIEENSFLQISFSATDMTLMDRKLYQNFFSVIPDDSKQIETMILLMKQLSWNRIAIIYEENFYCQTCIQVLTKQLQENSICVSKQLVIKVSDDGDVSIDQINSILDDIMLQSPFIGGLILFASRNTANNILRAADNKGIADVPLFILSTSVGLENDVFLSATDTVLQKSKGSLVVSPPYFKVTSFSEYWLSLMTNITNLKKAAISNPWLTDVFLSVANCNPVSDPSCQALSFENAEYQFSMQPVYIRYGILAVHTMAKASFQLYNKICSENATNCLVQWKNDFKPYMMIDEIKSGLSVNFGTDFPEVSVEPFTSSKYHMTFENFSEPLSVSDRELYQVYNYRKSPGGSRDEDFLLIKIGSLIDDHKLQVDFDSILDYAADGTETRFPNLRKGICPVGHKCSECIKANVADRFIHVPGDVYVIGIVPINDKALEGPIGCGAVRSLDSYQLALALQYGVEMFKTGSDFHDYRTKFGGKQIGLIVLNSCFNNLTIARKILDLHEFGLTLENGEHLDLSNKILGYVGGFASWVSVSAATQLTITGHVQVSYASTYPTLSDQLEYPYFLRLVAQDSVQADAMMEVIKAIKGEYVQVVYNECSCGSARRTSIELMARKHGICVAQFIEVKLTDSYFRYYEILRKKPHAKLVIIFLSSSILTNFMENLNDQMNNGEFQFLGSESWGGNNDLLKYDIVKGSLCVTMQLEEIKGLRSYIQEKVPNREQYDPWLEQYIQKRQNCYFSWSYDKTFSRECTDEILPPAEKNEFQSDFWNAFATNSLLALLMGSSEFYHITCRSNHENLCPEFVSKPSGLYEEVKKISLDISGTGPIKLFDDVGDGNMGFQIYNIKEDESDTLTYVRVGRYSMKSGLEMNQENVVFPTAEAFVSSCPNEQACQGCSDTKPTESKSGSDPTDGGKIALGVLVGILALGVVILVVLLVLEKRKASDDPYITPSGGLERPEAIGKSDSPYHSTGMIPETSY